LFKTVKYGPAFPEQFNSIEEAEAFLVEYFRWYNEEHRHCMVDPENWTAVCTNIRRLKSAPG
jgi:hypothetical protein